MRTLYICYFGLREPLVRTQVLPYLRELSDAGISIHLLTFEPDPWPQPEVENEKARLRSEGIEWFQLRYHKRPSVPATLRDILGGAWFAARLVRRAKLDVLHARAHVPLAMALLARLVSPARLIFDLRGLMAEEYADARIWSEGSTTYRAVKWLERLGLRRADHIVVLTERMRDRLISEGASAERVTAIPCCVDFTRYRSRDEQESSVNEKNKRFEVVYAGSVTGLYMVAEMGQFFLELRAREPRAFLRVLTKSSAEAASSVLKRAGVAANDFEVIGVSASEVPRHLQSARIGLSFRKPTSSQIAASPTKIAEYLAAGLPVVSNSGIGDTDTLLERERVGVLVHEFTREEFARAAEAALKLVAEPGTKQRCIALAREHFDLSAVGGPRYVGVYRRLQTRDAA